MLAIDYHVYIWQMSPQLSCGDTCQIWMWFKGSSSYFCKIENFAYGEINEQSYSNPHPWTDRFRAVVSSLRTITTSTKRMSCGRSAWFDTLPASLHGVIAKSVHLYEIIGNNSWYLTVMIILYIFYFTKMHIQKSTIWDGWLRLVNMQLMFLFWNGIPLI